MAMGQCPRRGRRAHSNGICGIPAGVTLGFGARMGGIQRQQGGQFPIEGRPKWGKVVSTGILEKLLEVERGKETEFLKVLAMLTPDMDAYQIAADALEVVLDAITILKRQLAERMR